MNKTTKQTTKEQESYPDWPRRGYEIEHDRDPHYLLYKKLVALKKQVETVLLPEMKTYMEFGPADLGCHYELAENLQKLYDPTIKEISKFCERLEQYNDSLI